MMKTRSAKTNKTIHIDRGCSSTSTGLDENLWSSLQHHIDLAENVYSKLPFEEFFHLRTVCKDWYVIACKRLGLKEPIHKPFFTLIRRSGVGRLDGILIYNAMTRSWDWRPGWSHNRFFDFVASDGVVFSADHSTSSNHASAFHWQSKMFRNLDLPPTSPSTHKTTILGIIVIEKQERFSSFKVVRGSHDFDTQVYESGVWQTKPCRVPKYEEGGRLQASTGCIDCNGRVYITTAFSREIFVYDFEKARWSSLFSPGDWVSKRELLFLCPDTLGAWNSRVFAMICDFESGHNMKNWSLRVWELVDETLHKWKVYDCMPKELWAWLRSTRDLEGLSYPSIDMHTSFCGDFMLVHSWEFSRGCAERFCLFNMATKNWQKLDIAAGTVVVKEED